MLEIKRRRSSLGVRDFCDEVLKGCRYARYLLEWNEGGEVAICCFESICYGLVDGGKGRHCGLMSGAETC